MTISVVAIVRGENEYIKEFVRHHRKVGVDRFYFYDNGLPDDLPLNDVLEHGDGNYEDCIVVSFPGQARQLFAYRHFIGHVLPHTDDEWIAFIDIDEFICPVKHDSLRAFLVEYGFLECIALNWRLFGANGHVTKPPGDVRKHYTKSIFDRHTKTLAHRSALVGTVDRVTCVHNVTGAAKTLRGRKIQGAFCDSDDTDIIRINHYATKSVEEMREKLRKDRADVGPGQRGTLTSWNPILEDRGAVDDTVILKYL